MSKDDPKKLLRCPTGCGTSIDFTSLAKCVRCGKVCCDVCIQRFKQRPYCKPCVKEAQRENSLRANPKLRQSEGK